MTVFGKKSSDSKSIASPKHPKSLRRSLNVRSSASNARLCAIVHTSYMMILDYFKIMGIADFAKCYMSLVHYLKGLTENLMLDEPYGILSIIWPLCQKKQLLPHCPVSQEQWPKAMLWGMPSQFHKAHQGKISHHDVHHQLPSLMYHTLLSVGDQQGYIRLNWYEEFLPSSTSGIKEE